MATLYLETTIPSYLTARRSRDLITAARQAITHDWWHHRRGDFELRVSDAVLFEAGNGDPDAASLRLQALGGLDVLDAAESIDDIARAVFVALSLPDDARLDSVHIAYCLFHQVDYLLTWNCRHIANAANRPKLATIASNLLLPLPTICTPEELL